MPAPSPAAARRSAKLSQQLAPAPVLSSPGTTSGDADAMMAIFAEGMRSVWATAVRYETVASEFLLARLSSSTRRTRPFQTATRLVRRGSETMGRKMAASDMRRVLDRDRHHRSRAFRRGCCVDTLRLRPKRDWDRRGSACSLFPAENMILVGKQNADGLRKGLAITERSVFMEFWGGTMLTMHLLPLCCTTSMFGIRRRNLLSRSAVATT